MTVSLRSALCALLCSALSLVAGNALAAPFSINHDTAYADMDLPIDLGSKTELVWDLECCEMALHLPGATLEVVSLDGVAQFGRLRSVAANWNPDGSLGEAEYLFGKGDFAFELVVKLLDGSLHTMRMHGDTGLLSVNADEGAGDMNAPMRGKVDRESAKLFGIDRRATGGMFFYLDTHGENEGVRAVSVFGSMDFNYAPPGPSTAVPEPATLALVVIGLAGLARRRAKR